MSRNRKRTRQRPYISNTPAQVPVQLEEKVNPAYSGMVLFGDVPQPHMMPKNYKSYALEGYRGNPTLFKCINYIITNGAAIPPVLFTDESMQKKIEKHPLLDKLKRPNVEQSGVAYRKAVLGYYLVAGNSYQYAIRKGTQGPPDELWTLQPDKVEILPTRTRGVVGYDYDDFKNTNPPQNPIDAANIAHLKTWAPDDPLFGVSTIEIGALMVDQQTAAQKWNLSVLQNSGRMTGAFTTPIIMSANDRSKVEDKINEKMAGFRNAGRIAVLDGGLTWQSMSVPPSEMDWLPGIQYNAGSLANLYNMPPQLIGDTSSTTYDNMEQAKAASYTEEIFPILDDLYALWNAWLLPMYSDLVDANGKPTAYLYYDKESVEVVQAVIQAKKTAAAERAVKAWVSGACTLNQAFVMQGLPEIGPDGDVLRFGAIIVRVAELGKYADQSLTTPAAPPFPQPEPLNVPPAQGNTNNDNSNNNDGKHPPANSDGGDNHAGGKSQRVSRRHDTYAGKAASDTDEGHTGVMVALFLDAKTAKKLALPDGEPASELHVTLAYLGSTDDLDIDLPAIKKTLSGYASEASPLQGNVGGIGRFTADGDLTPVYASVNIPGLQEWRAGLVKQLEADGYEVDKTFDFTPHITLAYIDADDPMPVDSVDGIDLSFDQLWLAVGDDRYSFSIGDEQHPKKRKKALDASGVYQPDDVNQRLADLQAQGVTQLMCLCDADPCQEICAQNDGVTVDLGKPFPSGHLMEPFHPYCQCKTVPIINNPLKSMERRERREDYQKFMEKVLA